MKLTKLQKTALEDLAMGRDDSFSADRTTVSLIRAGLIEKDWSRASHGNEYVRLTDAGVKVAKQLLGC